MDHLNPQPTKQNYHKPELITYGTVRSLTNALGNKGNFDAPQGGGNTTTTPTSGNKTSV